MQNNTLHGTLKQTYVKILAEASVDKLWGTGIPLRDKDVLTKAKWETPGWLSQMLLKICNCDILYFV